MSTLKSIADDAGRSDRVTEVPSPMGAVDAPGGLRLSPPADAAARATLGEAVRVTEALHATLAPFEARDALATNETCDVLIVGGGIGGAFAAQQLAAAGLDVVLVDRATPGEGATRSSTALIQYEPDRPLVELIPMLGLADAQAVYRQARSALDELRLLIQERGFACDLVERPTLYLARTDADVPHLHHESIAREQIGMAAPFVDAKQLAERYQIDRPGAIRSPLAFELDPRKLTFALLADATTNGARVYSRTSVGADPWVGGMPTMRTSDGHSIQCGHVVYATGYAAIDQFPVLRQLCELRTTFAVVAWPREEEPSRWWRGDRPMLWELGDPYFYARSTTQGQLIIGGEDVPLVTPDSVGAVLPGKVAALLDQLRRTTGIRDVTVERAFGATFAQTPDGLPFIGSPDCSERCFFALGYGGNGILFGLIAAQVIRERLLGRSHPAERLFSFDRPTANGIEFGGCP